MWLFLLLLPIIVNFRFQGSLQDYLVDTEAEIDLEALPLPATTPAGPVKKPTHTVFLLEVIFDVTVPANVSNVLSVVTVIIFWSFHPM